MEPRRSVILSSDVRSGNSTAAFNQYLQPLPQQISINSRASGQTKVFSFGNPINSDFIKQPLHNSYMSFGNRQSLQVSTQYNNNTQPTTNYVQPIYRVTQSDLRSQKQIGQLNIKQHNIQSLRPISIIIPNQDVNINTSNSTSSNQQKIQQNPYRYKKNINYRMQMTSANMNDNANINRSNNINNNTNTKVISRANTNTTDNDMKTTTVTTPYKAYNVTQIRNQQLNKQSKKDSNCFCF